MTATHTVTNWTKEENKLFEIGLATHWNDLDRIETWTKLAAMQPDKDVAQLIRRYNKLKTDVTNIDQGLVPDFEYRDSFIDTCNIDGQTKCSGRKRRSSEPLALSAPESCPNIKTRKKNDKWTTEEEDLFILGVELYGRGNWKVTREQLLPHKTIEQVSTYNQKFWKRHDKAAKAAAEANNGTVVTLADGKKRHAKLTIGGSTWIYDRPSCCKNFRRN